MIDIGVEPSKSGYKKANTIGDLINLRIADLQEVGKPIRRSKRAVLRALKRDLGTIRIHRLDRAELIKYGKKHSNAGAGQVTLAVDLSYLRTILTHAATVHGMQIDTESIRFARSAFLPELGRQLN